MFFDVFEEVVFKRSVYANVYQKRSLPGTFMKKRGDFLVKLVSRTSQTLGKVFGNQQTRKKWSRSLISRISRWSRLILMEIYEISRFPCYVLSKGFCSNTRKSLKFRWFTIKISRDHRDIYDMKLRDHFFRVQLFPKTFPCDWEVLEVRLQRELQANVKISELRFDIHRFWYTLTRTSQPVDLKVVHSGTNQDISEVMLTKCQITPRRFLLGF